MTYFQKFVLHILKFLLHILCSKTRYFRQCFAGKIVCSTALYHRESYASLIKSQIPISSVYCSHITWRDVMVNYMIPISRRHTMLMMTVGSMNLRKEQVSRLYGKSLHAPVVSPSSPAARIAILEYTSSTSTQRHTNFRPPFVRRLLSNVYCALSCCFPSATETSTLCLKK